MKAPQRIDEMLLLVGHIWKVNPTKKAEHMFGFSINECY